MTNNKKDITKPELVKADSKPALEHRARRAPSFIERHAVWIVLIVSTVFSIAATFYYFKHGQILAYNDARSHLDIARRVIDNKTPGIAQFGGTWLPLPQALMLPFVANYALWHTGLAGSIVSMLCYVLSAFMLFKIVHLMTESVYAGFLGSAIFLLNSNALYMQSTPMTEMPLLAAMLTGSYFFVRWLYKNQMIDLVLAAFGVFLATLMRYEGWFVLAMCSGIILFDRVILAKKKQTGEGQAIIFTTLGVLGIFLWVLWNALIWGNPFYFLNGDASAAAQQGQLAAAGQLPTKHNLLLSLLVEMKSVSLNIGLILPIVAVLGIVGLMLFRNRSKRLLYALLVLLAPVLLDFITLYAGVTTIRTSWATMFNVRYGLMALPFVATAVALVVFRFRWHWSVRLLASVVVVICTIVAPVATLWDPVHGSSGTSSSTLAFTNAIEKDYSGGNILASAETFDPIMQALGIPLVNYIHEGNGPLWHKTLVDPQSSARYIMMNISNGNDSVFKAYEEHKKLYDENYRVVYKANGYELLARKT